MLALTIGEIPLWALIPALIILKIFDVIIMVEIYHKYNKLRKKVIKKRKNKK